MLKVYLILATATLLGASPNMQAPPATSPAPAESKIPLEAVNQPNPVKPTPESLARAKKIYGYDCAVCHGEDGGGSGDLAKSLKSKVSDFRDPAAMKGQTDGELFYIINAGKGEMPGEGPRANTNDTWNLVNYVRSFSKLQSATAVHGPS